MSEDSVAATEVIRPYPPSWLDRLTALVLPFKVGFLKGGRWQWLRGQAAGIPNEGGRPGFGIEASAQPWGTQDDRSQDQQDAPAKTTEQAWA